MFALGQFSQGGGHRLSTKHAPNQPTLKNFHDKMGALNQQRAFDLIYPRLRSPPSENPLWVVAQVHLEQMNPSPHPQLKAGAPSVSSHP